MLDRAEIIRDRYVKKPNLEILQGNMFSISKLLKTNYITSIGVLEYAGLYFDSKTTGTPHQAFLNFLASHLNPKGTLLLAIENKLGYKYLTGSPEDHLNRLFVSLENYPVQRDVQTFSKLELTQMLTVAGFSHIQFYYPFPDYKLPSVVFSEDGLLEDLNIGKSIYSYVADWDASRVPIFSELPFVSSLHTEKVLSHFANSFLIEATL